jgi:hypothetical protein
MNYKVAPLTVNPRQKSNILSRVFVSQPSAEEELLIGRLFILLELEIAKPEDARLIDFLITDAYEQYYENEALILRDRLANLKPEIIFEATIAKINRDLAAFLEQEKINLHPGALNAVVGIIYGNKLFFAQTGAGKALLLYRPKNKRGEFLLDYSLVDITEKTNDPTQEIIQTNKFFTNVVAGAVPAHGYFFFANESLFEYLTKKQITDIITTLPPTGAAEQMKNLLEQTNAFVPFFGLIVKNNSGEHDAFAAPAASLAVPGSLPVGAGRLSVNQLNLTQEKTEQLLSPSGMVNVRKWLDKLKPASSSIKDFATSKARQINIAREKTNLAQKTITLGKKIIEFTGIIISLLTALVKNIIKFITDKNSREQLIEKTKQTAKKIAQSTVNSIDRFSRLSPRYKALIIVIAVCLVGLLGNIIYSGINNQHKKTEAQIAAVSEQFTQKENQLDAALLYNDRTGAKQILDNLATLLASLPKRTASEKTTQAAFKKRYETKLDSLYNVIRLTDASPLLELPAEADYLLADNGNVLAIASGSKAVWKINNDKTIAAKTYDIFPSSLVGASVDTPLEYYVSSDKVISFKAETGEFASFNIDNPPSTIDAASVYNNKLYVVSGSNIYRYTLDKKTNTFNSRIDWLKETVTMSKVNNMTIDGRIYIIANNNLIKLANGKNNNLVLDDISPKLEEPKAVYVSQDADFLYLLEPKNQRLLVYTKSGKYLAQYTGDMLTNLTGAAIDEKNHFVYLMNGKQIFRTPATHFNLK